MRPSEALDLKRSALREAATRCHAESLRVVGAALLANDWDSNDLDLLVDPLPGAMLFDLGDRQVEHELSA